MKAQLALGALSLALSVAAEDILFPQLYPRFNLKSNEFARAQAMGMTVKLVSIEEWGNMTTNDFAQFKAIVIADQPSAKKDTLQFLVDSQEIWGPAVNGNMMLIGTDPSNHCCRPGQGPEVLIDNALKFCANGTWPDGTPKPGLYFALSQYYDGSATPEIVDTLSYFGVFTARGKLGCYDNVHIVATSSALGPLDDSALSNWQCSIHEVFVRYPPDFQALAIGKDVQGLGNDTFGDGTSGVPYIISRGATPAGCGDGRWDKDLGEECDDGNTLDGDGCDKSCRCEPGFRADGNGKCLTVVPTSSVVNSTSVVSSTSSVANATGTATGSMSTTSMLATTSSAEPTGEPVPSSTSAAPSSSTVTPEVPEPTGEPESSTEVPATSTVVPPVVPTTSLQPEPEPPATSTVVPPLVPTTSVEPLPPATSTQVPSPVVPTTSLGPLPEPSVTSTQVRPPVPTTSGEPMPEPPATSTLVSPPVSPTTSGEPVPEPPATSTQVPPPVVPTSSGEPLPPVVPTTSGEHLPPVIPTTSGEPVPVPPGTSSEIPVPVPVPTTSVEPLPPVVPTTSGEPLPPATSSPVTITVTVTTTNNICLPAPPSTFSTSTTKQGFAEPPGYAVPSSTPVKVFL